MKWIILLISSVLLPSCCLTTGIICNERASATIVEPLMVFPYSNGPVDTTTTTIDFY